MKNTFFLSEADLLKPQYCYTSGKYIKSLVSFSFSRNVHIFPSSDNSVSSNMLWRLHPGEILKGVGGQQAIKNLFYVKVQY